MKGTNSHLLIYSWILLGLRYLVFISLTVCTVRISLLHIWISLRNLLTLRLLCFWFNVKANSSLGLHFFSWSLHPILVNGRLTQRILSNLGRSLWKKLNLLLLYIHRRILLLRGPRCCRTLLIEQGCRMLSIIVIIRSRTIKQWVAFPHANLIAGLAGWHCHATQIRSTEISCLPTEATIQKGLFLLLGSRTLPSPLDTGRHSGCITTAIEQGTTKLHLGGDLMPLRQYCPMRPSIAIARCLGVLLSLAEEQVLAAEGGSLGNCGRGLLLEVGVRLRWL